MIERNMGNNYFITGGAGFIGSNYVNRLIERGERVTIYDNLRHSNLQLGMCVTQYL
jgi:nucleoside-diphosphate-sugar epimerase